MNSIEEKRICIPRPARPKAHLPLGKPAKQTREERWAERITDTNKVRNDHFLHWAALLYVSFYAWQLHGIWGAVGCFVGVLVVISISNTILMAKGGFTWIRFNRWGWLLSAFVALAISGAKACKVGVPC